MASVTEIDRKDLAAYCKSTKIFGAQDPGVDVDAWVGDGDVVYMREDFYFLHLGTWARTEDWKLSAQQMDRMLYYARRTEKRQLQKEREDRRRNG